jgi:adenylosuccinate lyase
MIARLLAGVAIAFAPFLSLPAEASEKPDRVAEVFTDAHLNTLVMQVEAALAEAQAAEGVISANAAREIRQTASPDYAPLDAVAAEYEIVRHRMVALLNVWRRSLSEEARQALHFGATTVDIYDTVMILQLKDAIAVMRTDLAALETSLMRLAIEHRDTPTIGRTLGQHALPITFGKKVSVWAAANRRNIERLNDVECRLNELGVMRGAVGTHLGLGPHGIAIEKRVASRLGLGPVAPADWHGMRDVFGEYAAALAIMARTHAKIGEEIFRMQMTELGEVREGRAATAVSSSAMPHKQNPNRSEALIHYGRTIPAQADILMADIANEFERDNTSRTNQTLVDMTLLAGDMIRDADRLIARLEVDKDQMARNLALTDGMILSQRIVFEVQDALGKEEAERHVGKAARRSVADGIPFADALMQDERLRPLLDGKVEALLDPATYMGLSAQQVDATATWLKSRPITANCAR